MHSAKEEAKTEAESASNVVHRQVASRRLDDKVNNLGSRVSARSGWGKGGASWGGKGDYGKGGWQTKGGGKGKGDGGGD